MVRALDLQTGQVRWATNVRPGPAEYFFHGDPMLTDDLLVIGADTGGVAGFDAGVHAFELATGKQRWLYSAGSGVAGAIKGVGGLAYAARLDGELLALDVATGDRRWSVPLALWGWEGPAVHATQVLAGTRTGSLYSLQADTGDITWQTELGTPISTSVVAAPSGLYFGTANGRLFRMDSARGAILKSIVLSDGQSLRPRGVPVVTNDSVLVLLADRIGNPKVLVSIDLTLTTVRWQRPAPTTWTTARVLIQRDTAVLGTADGEVIAYCLENGEIAGATSVQGAVRSIGGVGDTLLVGTTAPTGTLYALPFTSSCRDADATLDH